MSHIGRDLDTHWESSIYRVSKFCGDNTNDFARLVKLKAIKHNIQVNLGETFIGSSVVYYILNLWEWLRLAHYHFIEFTEIRDPSNPAVLIGYDETGEATGKSSVPIGISTPSSISLANSLLNISFL